MIERRVVFETIKIGETLADYWYRPPPFIGMTNYASIYWRGLFRPIADVLPFHIVSGHITTSLDPQHWEIVLASLDAEGWISESIPAGFSRPKGPYPAGGLFCRTSS